MVLELTRQDVLNLTNDKKCKALLASWQSWGLWCEVPEIGLSVHRLNLPDGSFFSASWYAGDDFYPANGNRNVNRPRFNFGGKGDMLKAKAVAESVLTDKLRALRKELLGDANA